MFQWEKNVRKVVPYTPGEQPEEVGIIKLNTNENPYPPAPGVEWVLQNLDTDRLRLYPDPASKQLTKTLAQRYELQENQIFVGVGSDDVLAMAFLTFFNSGKPVFFPDITYSFYDVWAELYGIPYECQPLDENFCICKEDYKKENGGIVIANPNAPTGIALDLESIREILESNPESIVIIDEAYVDFGGESCIPLIAEYDNLLVVQTFSKSRSMAGMRIGYAMGHPKLIRYLNDVKYSFNSYTMNLPSQKCGVAAIKDEAYFQECLQKIMTTRERVQNSLREMGFEFSDSKTNFIFVRHPKISAKALFEFLKEKKIFVRYFPKPRISEYLRITIGTEEEMDQLLKVVKEYQKIEME